LIRLTARWAQQAIESDPAVVYMAGPRLASSVPFMTVMANEMPFVGRG
jgi:hypothetical protein